MADVFWTRATSLVASADYSRAFLPVRLQGAAADGSQDTFAQVVLPAAGTNGKSAYQIWLDQGHTGTQADFLSSLAGAVTASVVVSALSYTPYDAANPASYVTVSGARSALSGSGGISYDPATGTAKLANMAAGTIKGNAGTGSAAPSDLTGTQVAGMVQPFLIANAMGSSMTVAPSQAAVAAALAGKLDKSGGALSGPVTTPKMGVDALAYTTVASGVVYRNLDTGVYEAYDRVNGIYELVSGSVVLFAFTATSVAFLGKTPILLASTERQLSLFLKRVEDIAAGNYDRLLGNVSDPYQLIKLRSAVSVNSGDTALKSAVQAALGITDTQWNGLFA